MKRIVMTALAALSLFGAPTLAAACPFCTATSQTLSEEMIAADAAILAKLVAGPPEQPADATAADVASSFSTFKVTRVLKGDEHVKVGDEIKALHFGEVQPDGSFLITGTLVPEMGWGTPIPLNPKAEEYVGKLLALPDKGAERLNFFQDFFEHEDPVLAQDAYDEFARAPYDDVKELKNQMRHDELVAWIKNVDLSPSHRRLYLTMLSVCGSDQDLPMLEEMMRADDRRKKAGLDALIACYLTLRGPDGMPVVEELFLKNPKAEYADTYAAIMALRFHGQEADIIPKPRLLEGLRHMLGRPDLADLVISDLARWEDWSVMDQLIALFKSGDDTSSWVRVPVVNYLQAAAQQKGAVGEKAAAAIVELEKIDPSAVKQARTFAAFGGLGSSKVEPAADVPPVEPAEAGAAATPDDDPAPSIEAETAESAPPENRGSDVASAPEPVQVETNSPSNDAPIAAAGKRIAIFLVLGVVVLACLRLVSRGARR